MSSFVCPLCKTLHPPSALTFSGCPFDVGPDSFGGEDFPLAPAQRFKTLPTGEIELRVSDELIPPRELTAAERLGLAPLDVVDNRSPEVRDAERRFAELLREDRAYSDSGELTEEAQKLVDIATAERGAEPTAERRALEGARYTITHDAIFRKPFTLGARVVPVLTEEEATRALDFYRERAEHFARVFPEELARWRSAQPNPTQPLPPTEPREEEPLPLDSWEE